MNFDKVLDNLDLLIDIPLKSIKPGSDIIIKQINRQLGRITILTSSDKLQTRPINELKIIWQKMHEQPAIHVDEALHGSGTSRNQPETIMANLPYIEWFKYNNKKHIALIGNNTHRLGTLKKMSEIEAEALRNKLRGEADNKKDISVVIVTDDIYKTTKIYENLNGITAIPIQNGVYLLKQQGKNVLFVISTLDGKCLPVGTYIVVKKPADSEFIQQVELNGIKYSIRNINGLNFFVEL